MKNLSRKVEEVTYDGLITDLTPPVEVRGGIIKGISGGAVLKRGTLLARNTSDDTLSVYNGATETAKPYGILCDDTTVGTENLECAVYTAGCFDADKVILKEGYTLKAADLDEMRMRNIVFKNAQKM